VTRALFLSLFIIACDAPTIGVAASDASGDASNDTNVVSSDASACEAKTLLVDGGSCGDRDEDGDCVPDDCDRCPNVPWEFVAKYTMTNPSFECITPRPQFDHITKRIAFDGFAAKVSSLVWIDPQALAFKDEKFRVDLAAGVARIGAGTAEHSATLKLDLGPRDVSVIAFMRFADVGGGGGGIALRHSYEPLADYACLIDPLELKIMATCGPGCTPTVLVKKPAPEVDLLKPFVMRASVATIDGKVAIECQVFPAPRTQPDVKLTLLQTVGVENNTISTLITSSPLLDGDVGVRVQSGSLIVDSFDVLGAP
jgi:hypothetical protein